MQNYKRAYITDLNDDYPEFYFKDEISGGNLKTFLFGRQNYPDSVNRILMEVKDDKIKQATVYRKPIIGRKFLNIISLGYLNKAINESKFDELFHLRILFTLESGKKLYVEKNQNLNVKMSEGIEYDKGSFMIVPSFPNITLFDALENTRKLMGDKRFFIYSARKSNCQDFVLNMLKANNCLTYPLEDFIKQDIDKIFKKYKIFETISDIGTTSLAKIEDLFTGGNESENQNAMG